MNRVSVKAVDLNESNTEDALMLQFYSSVNIVPNDPILGWFGVIAVPFSGDTLESFWVNINGSFGRPNY